MNKNLLVISKNYWGANTSEKSANDFLNTFVKIVDIKDSNCISMIGENVDVTSVKNILYNTVFNILKDNTFNHILYIYMNGHGNQIYDTNQDEKSPIEEGETIKDNMDEIYQLPDGIILDDEITDIIERAVRDSGGENRLIVVLISDHCSSGSMIDKKPSSYDWSSYDRGSYDWITIGSSLDNQDSYIIGDGNVMTNNLLNLLQKIDINTCNTMLFYRLLTEEMKNSFIGDIQTATLHVSHPKMFTKLLFNL